MGVRLQKMRFPLLFLVLSLAPMLSAENWPQWRGPRMDGTSNDKGFPEKLDPEQLLWKVELPGGGHSSPIVWNDRVFLTACLDQSQKRVLLCLDRSQGKVLWQSAVLSSPLEHKHGLNSLASSTPATDGERIYTTFLDTSEPDPQTAGKQLKNLTPGQAVVSAHDFSGNLVWQKHVGRFSSVHGFCSSPILFKDKVIVNCDQDGDGFMLALARTDGHELWRVDRPNHTRSYCAPMIREMAGKTQMVLAGSKCVASYDPNDGKLIWIMDGPTEQFVASLVYNDQAKLLLLTAGFPEHHVMGIRPDGSGNVTTSHVAWHTNEGAAYVPSPITLGDWCIIVSDSGVAHCYEAKSGRIAWEERLREHHASPTTAEGKAWFINDRGILHTIQPGEKYEEIAEAEIGEKVFASPAMSDGQIFVRGDKSLFCFGQRRGVATAGR